MPRLRGNGDGTVTKRTAAADVRWQMAIYDENGKGAYCRRKRELSRERRY